jgi:hypothetical protein
MKKFIPIVIFLVLSCSGGLVKRQLFNIWPNFLSEPNLNHCLQNILWLPIDLLGAAVPLFFPQLFLDGVNELLNRSEDPSQIKVNLWKIRLLGAWFFIPTVLFSLFNPIYWNYCMTAFGISDSP